MTNAQEELPGGTRPASQGRLVRMVAADGQIRAAACVTTRVVERARVRHRLMPTAAAALGRLMTAAVLMASSLKGRERVMLQIVGDGPIRHVVAQADARLTVRGYVGDPLVHLPLNGAGKLDVARAIGKGSLYVIRDLGLREPYRGAVPLVTGEIAQDVAHYLAHSEQTPAAVALGVLVEPDTRIRAAGGWMVTPLPGASPDLLGELEARLKQAPQVSRAIDALGKGAQESPAALLEELLAPWRPRILAEQPVAFHCSCSRSRFEAGLVALGPKELLDIAREQDPVELRCRFCGRRYLFSAERIRQLAARAAGPRLRVVKGTGASTS